MSDLDSIDVSEIDFSEPQKELSQVKELEIETSLDSFKLFYPFKQLTFSCLTTEDYNQSTFLSSNIDLKSNKEQLGVYLRKYLTTYVFKKQKYGPELQRAYDLKNNELSSDNEIHLVVLQYRIALESIFNEIRSNKSVQMLIHTQNNSLYVYYDYKDAKFYVFGETRIMQNLYEKFSFSSSLEPIIFNRDDAFSKDKENDVLQDGDDQKLKMDIILEYLMMDCPIQSSGVYQLPIIVSNKQFNFNQVEYPLLSQDKSIIGVFLEEHVSQLLKKIAFHKDLIQFTISCQPVSMMHCIMQRDIIINNYILGGEPRKFNHMKGDIQELILDTYMKTVKLIIL